MKILLVAPINLGSADPHYSWFKALIQLGQQVKLFPLNHFPQLKLIKSWQLRQEILKFKPDKIFFSAGKDAVYPLKNTIFFCGVPLTWLSASERKTGLSAELVVTNDDRHALSWQQLGAKKAINLPISAIDPAVFKTQTAKTIPVSFVGTLFPYRQIQLVKIVQFYPNLKIWGRLEPGCKLLPQLKPCYQGEAWGAQLKRIYAKSLISLNLSPTHMRQGGNIRPFEIAGSRALLLTDQLNPDWYRAGQEAIVFTTPKDCVRKIHYYLSHPQQRKAIALKGWQRTIKDHTYFARFSQLIADITPPVLPSV